MLNLMPWRDEIFRKEKSKTITMMMAIFFLTSFTLISARFFLSYRLSNKVEQLKLLSVKIKNEIKLKEASLDKLKRSQKVLATYEALKQQNNLIHLIHEITSTLPTNTFLSSLEYEQKGLWLNGILLSNNQAILKKFITHLNQRLAIESKIIELNPLHYQKMSYKIFIPLSVSKIK
jgi:Tfp pilus assembly protein PilN